MIRFRTLGTVGLHGAEGTELGSVLAQPKRLALLAYLAIATPRGFHRRDTLLGLFWPDLDADHARSALNQALYYLRRKLGSEVVVSRGAQEVRVDRGRLWCDAVAFDEALAAEAPEEAVELYRGDLLRGFHLPDAPDWERWLEEERARLRALAAAAYWTLAEAAAGRLRVVEAGRWGRRAVALAPADEGLLRRLILLLDRVGDPSGAVRAYHEAVQRLARDYDLEPSPEIQRLIGSLGGRDGPDPEDAQPATPVVQPAPPATIVERPRRRASARRDALVGAGVVAVSVLLSTLVLSPRARNLSSAHPDQAAAGLDHRLAVLPLVDTSPDTSDAYLAPGLTQGLISRLSERGDLVIVARNSAMRFAGPTRDLARIGSELGAGTLLSGSFARDGRTIQLSLELVRTGTLERLWTKDYAVEVARLSAVESDIAEEVSRAMRLPSGANSEEAAPPGPAAYTEGLKGRYYLTRLDADAPAQARDHFQRALNLDPTYARAWAGLARSYAHLTGLMQLPASEAYPRIRAASEHALALNPDLAEAHAALGLVLAMYDWETEGAERELRRAIELDPGSSWPHLVYGKHLRNLGRLEEALREVRLAESLDPLFVAARVDEGVVLYMLRRYDDAMERFQQLLRAAPDQKHAYIFIAKVYAERGEFEKALAALRAMGPQPRRPDVQATRGYIYARMGQTAKAQAALARLDTLAREQVASPFHRAAVYVGLGQHDRALDLLEQAAKHPTWQLRLLKTEPLFDPLRTDPRFRAILRRVNLLD